MSTLTYFVRSIIPFVSSTGSTEELGPTGANAVRTAVTEIEDLTNREFTGLLGEPEIHEGNGRFFSEPKVVVPIHDSPFESASRLVFDLPNSRDDDFSEFNSMLQCFDLGFETMEELDGEEVPMRFIGGNVAVVWDDLNVEDDSDKGGTADIEKGSEDDPHTAEEVAATVESDSNVNVEQETITGEEADA